MRASPHGCNRRVQPTLARGVVVSSSAWNSDRRRDRGRLKAPRHRCSRRAANRPFSRPESCGYHRLEMQKKEVPPAVTTTFRNYSESRRHLAPSEIPRRAHWLLEKIRYRLLHRCGRLRKLPVHLNPICKEQFRIARSASHESERRSCRTTSCIPAHKTGQNQLLRGQRQPPRLHLYGLNLEVLTL